MQYNTRCAVAAERWTCRAPRARAKSEVAIALPSPRVAPRHLSAGEMGWLFEPDNDRIRRLVAPTTVAALAGCALAMSSAVDAAHVRWTSASFSRGLLAALGGPSFFDAVLGGRWQTYPLHAPNGLPEWVGAMTLDDAEFVLSAFPERASLAHGADGTPPGVALVANSINATEEVAQLAAAGRPLTVKAARRGYEAGGTLLFNEAHKYWPAVAAMAAGSEDLLRQHVGVNVYFTPASSRGFVPHWDAQEVIVLQLGGAKTWRVFKPQHGVGPHALPNEKPRTWKDLLPDDAEPDLEVTLRGGDVLYVPQGWVHYCVTAGEASAHATISVNNADHRWGEMLRFVVDPEASTVPPRMLPVPAISERFAEGLNSVHRHVTARSLLLGTLRQLEQGRDDFAAQLRSTPWPAAAWFVETPHTGGPVESGLEGVFASLLRSWAAAVASSDEVLVSAGRSALLEARQSWLADEFSLSASSLDALRNLLSLLCDAARGSFTRFVAHMHLRFVAGAVMPVAVDGLSTVGCIPTGGTDDPAKLLGVPLCRRAGLHAASFSPPGSGAVVVMMAGDPSDTMQFPVAAEALVNALVAPAPVLWGPDAAVGEIDGNGNALLGHGGSCVGRPVSLDDVAAATGMQPRAAAAIAMVMLRHGVLSIADPSCYESSIVTI